MLDIFKKVYTKFQKWSEGDLGVSIRSDVALERLGTPYGGWIIPQKFIQQDAVCYLVGAGEDVSFDLALANQYGCTVHIFDPTPRAVKHVEQLVACIQSETQMPCATSPDGFYPTHAPAMASQIMFHPFGVWDEDRTLRFFAPENEAHVSHSLVNLQKSDQSIEVPVRSLETIMRDLGHSQIDLLKLDVEGAEYQILDSILKQKIKVHVLCIEFDETAANHLDRHYLQRIKSCLLELQNAGYEIIAKETDCRNYTLMHRQYLPA